MMGMLASQVNNHFCHKARAFFAPDASLAAKPDGSARLKEILFASRKRQIKHVSKSVQEKSVQPDALK